MPLAWRNQCSALLLSLNVCRKVKCYLPWECENEVTRMRTRTVSSYMRRMKALSVVKAETTRE
ncbi:hypothetical protein BJV77DRAFT_928592, partial [Russula vinacea]